MRSRRGDYEGIQVGEHGLFYKSIYPYRAHTHVPFIIKVPGGVKGKCVANVVSMLDLVPTVLDLAGVQPPCDLPGEVLTPVVRGDAAPQRKSALIEIDRQNTALGVLKMRMLITNDWKLVYYQPTNEKMLFDLRNDPCELKNLAGRPGYQEVVAEMFDQLTHELDRTEGRRV